MHWTEPLDACSFCQTLTNILENELISNGDMESINESGLVIGEIFGHNQLRS